MPTQILSNVATIAAGGYHSLAVSTTGALFTFSWNLYGQLGTATNSGTNNPNPTPTQVLTGVSAVAGGLFHSLAVKTDGTLWTFGFNYDGELGRIANVNTFVANPIPVQVLTGVDEIGAGAFHSLVMTDAGELMTFGWNIYGQLGVALKVVRTCRIRVR